MREYKTSNELLLKLFLERDKNYLTKDFKDYHSDNEITHKEMSENEIVSKLLDFLDEGSKLIYPAKSYFVAVIYALKLYSLTNEDPFNILKEDNLLPEDKYFKPLDNSNIEIYSKVLLIYNVAKGSLKQILNSKGALQVLEYFYEEFGEQYRCN